MSDAIDEIIATAIRERDTSAHNVACIARQYFGEELLHAREEIERLRKEGTKAEALRVQILSLGKTPVV